MANRKELDDFAQTVVLPDGATTHDDTERVQTMTVQELERMLKTSQRLKSMPTDSALDDDTRADAAFERDASYAEYLRDLDDVPVLRDVTHEPPRVPVRDFRLGQRPDVRRRPRDDAYVLREYHAFDLEQRYLEYVEALTKPARAAERGGTRKAARKKRGRSKGPRRAKRSKA